MAATDVDATPVTLRIVDTPCGAPFIEYIKKHILSGFPNAIVEVCVGS